MVKAKVERKLEEKMLTKVKAILLSNVSFNTFQGETNLKVGTEIVLEPEENIGYYNGYHFDIRKEEYKVLYLN